MCEISFCKPPLTETLFYFHVKPGCLSVCLSRAALLCIITGLSLLTCSNSLLAQTPLPSVKNESLSASEEIFGFSLTESSITPSAASQINDTTQTPNAVSETSSTDGNHSTTDKKPVSSRKNLGILDLEEHLAADRFEKNQNLENKSILIKTYEDMALALCFPPLKTILTAAPNTLSPDCEEILAKIESLHPNNTIATCARKGIDSVECAQSFERQSVRKFSRSEDSKFALIENSKDIVSSSGHYEKLQKNLLAEVDKYKADTSVENLKSLETASFSMLALLCVDDVLELKKGKKDLVDEDSSKNSIASIAESIKSLEDSVNSETAQTQEDSEEDPNFLLRTRIISERCYDTLTDLIAIDSRLPSPICFRDSFIAPSCLSALRRFRTLKDQLAPGQIAPTPTPRDSLHSF